MKNVKKILMLLVLITLITGCFPTSKKELTTKEQITKKYKYYNTIKCSEIDNVVDLGFAGFVTKDKAYELNVEQIYSNEENCIELPIDNLDGELINGDGKFAYTKTSIYGIGKGIRKEKNTNYEYSLFSSLGNNVIYHSSYGDYYIVSIDNKIKMIKVDSKEDNTAVITKTIDLDDEVLSNEKVISISESFIKTDKAYYKVIKYKENKEDCEKYADIKCKYGFKIKKDSVLTKNYNNILFAGYYIVDKDYNVYK